jgi:hypothetical protein
MNRKYTIVAVIVLAFAVLGVVLYGTKTTTSMQEPPHSTPNELATKHAQ